MAQSVYNLPCHHKIMVLNHGRGTAALRLWASCSRHCATYFGSGVKTGSQPQLPSTALLAWDIQSRNGHQTHVPSSCGNSVWLVITYLQYYISASALMAIGLLSCWPDGLELSRISSRTQQPVQTASGIYSKLTCSHDASASGTSEVLSDNTLFKSTHSLTGDNTSTDCLHDTVYVTMIWHCGKIIMCLYSLLVRNWLLPMSNVWSCSLAFRNTVVFSYAYATESP